LQSRTWPSPQRDARGHFPDAHVGEVPAELKILSPAFPPQVLHIGKLAPEIPRGGKEGQSRGNRGAGKTPPVTSQCWTFRRSEDFTPGFVTKAPKTPRSLVGRRVRVPEYLVPGSSAHASPSARGTRPNHSLSVDASREAQRSGGHRDGLQGGVLRGPAFICPGLRLRRRRSRAS
jgi:hypothetical protein